MDELYDVFFVDRAKSFGRIFSIFDSRVVDGVINGSATVTRISAWLSGQADIHIVDRTVNLVGEFLKFSSSVFRRVQTGFFQRYAFVFVIGLILMISFYLYMGV